MHNIRRILCLVLLAASALSLAACGSLRKKDPVDNAPAQVSSVVENVPVGEGGPVGTESASASSGGASRSGPVIPPADAEFPPNAIQATSEDRKRIAACFVNRDLQELIDAVGYPSSANYAASDTELGENGTLSYEGFTVYTYREGETEVVRSVA